MKVLWFTITPSLYNTVSNNPYFGCGWIESLQKKVENDRNIELALAFFHSNSIFKVKQGNTLYYPISNRQGILNKILNAIFLKRAEINEKEYFFKIINDFKPDVIQIFGSEKSFGLVCGLTKIPIILHLQGILNPYNNAFLIPGMSKTYFILKNKNGLFQYIKNIQMLRLWKHNCKREKIILQSCKNFFGRTNWDQTISAIYSPASKYFFCSEILRESFYQHSWNKKRESRFIISSTISPIVYKGLDLILRTAKLLMENTKIDFEWRVFGLNNFKIIDKLVKIDHKCVNVIYCGAITEKKLCEELMNADLYIHPSYIDNSPNSVCEAQILGMPIISTNVGGIGSLIEHEKNGLLIPANDPWILTANIKMLYENYKYAKLLGVNARQTALIRHNPTTIFDQIVKTYSTISNE